MKRRSFFEILTAAAAACLLPPIRAAKAVQEQVRTRVRHIPRWLGGRKHWEHLEVPIATPNTIMNAPDAKIVCRVLGPTHFRTNLHPEFGGFEAALEEAGWAPEEIQQRVDHNYGAWGVSVPCLACTRRVWVPVETSGAFEPAFAATSYESFLGWHLELKEGVRRALCPDHRDLRVPEALI